MNSNIDFTEIIHRTKSKFNNEIKVYRVGEARRLVVGGLTQSVTTNAVNVKNRVWGRIAFLVKKFCKNPKKVLILGLGGGTVPHLISEDFPEVEIISVEIDPVIVKVAKKYFGVKDIPNHRIIRNDALKVLAKPEKFGLGDNFDAVVVDMYCGRESQGFKNREKLFEDIRAVLKKGGAVIFNKISTQVDDPKEFTGLVREKFGSVETLPVTGIKNSDNILVYAVV